MILKLPAGTGQQSAMTVGKIILKCYACALRSKIVYSAPGVCIKHQLNGTYRCIGVALA